MSYIQNMKLKCKLNDTYNIFYRIHVPPQIDVPPPKYLDHVPKVSSPKIYMTTLFNDQCNAVLMICLLHPMK